MLRNYAIAGYVVGFTFSVAVFCAIAYLVFMPFGIGYIGAELAFGYAAWGTAYRWELLNAHLQAHLEARGY
jgi:hypothetical protein